MNTIAKSSNQNRLLTPQQADGKITVHSEKMINFSTTTQEDSNMNTVKKEIVFKYKKLKDKQTGMESQRAPETLNISFPEVTSLVSELEKNLNSTDETIKKSAQASLDLLQAAVEDVITAQARSLLENSTAATFQHSQIDWQYIANLPPAARRGAGIPAEVWEAFLEDYKRVMPGVTGKTEEQIERACAILGRRLATVKTSKDHLYFFQQQLGLYMNSSPDTAQEFADVLEFLNNKIEEYLNLSPEALLANL